MRILLLLFICFPVLLQAQSDSCETLPIFFNHTFPVCEEGELDSSCFIMNRQYEYPHSGQQWPGCSGAWALNNPSWITFVAGATQTELSINIFDCDVYEGAQLAIYEIPRNLNLNPNAYGINPYQLQSELITDCSFVQCTTGLVDISISTDPGQLYAIVIDGCNGDVCKIGIEEFQTASPPHVDSTGLGQIMISPDSYELGVGPDTICLGAQVVPFYLPEAMDLEERFVWKKNGALVDEGIFDAFTFISFPDTGNYDICAAVTNYCDTSEFVCKTVEVAPLDTLFMFDTICKGEQYNWRGPFDIPLGVYGPFSGDTSDYYFDSVAISPYLCEQLGVLNLHVIENNEHPIPIDTFTTYPDLPFTIYGYEIVGPVKSKSIKVDHAESCDSIYSLDLEVFGGVFFARAFCGSEEVCFKFSGINDTSLYTEWEQQFQIFENDPDFSYSAIWSAHDSSQVLSDSLELVLSREELRDLATDSIGHLNLFLTIMHKDDTIFYDSIEYEYDLRVNFLDLTTDINITGDSLIAKDSLALYQWLRCDSNFQVIPHANDRVFHPQESGYYAVEITKTICKDTSDCIYFSTTTTTTDRIQKPIRIIPNPTTGQFKIDYIPTSLLGEQYSVYSMTGELLLSASIQEHKTFDLSAYPPGIYLLRIQNRVLRIVKI